MGKRDKMVACLVCGLVKRQDSMARHMRAHTTQRARTKGRFDKSKLLNVPGVLEAVSDVEEDVPRVVEDVPRVVENVSHMAENDELYCFKSGERQDLTHDNTH